MKTSSTRGEGFIRRKSRQILEITGSVVVAGLAMAAYAASGLYGAVESEDLKAFMGVLIALWFVANFRVGLYGK